MSEFWGDFDHVINDPDHPVRLEVRGRGSYGETDELTIQLHVGRRIYRFRVCAQSTGPSDAGALCFAAHTGPFDYERQGE